MTTKITLLFVAILFVASSLFAQNNISFSADVTSGCAPLNVTFTNNSTIDTTGVTFYWSFNDGNNFIGYDTSNVFYAGYYRVWLHAYGQFGNYLGGYSMDISVQGSPNFFNISTGNNVCEGENINFSSYGGSWNIFWDFGDGTTSTDYSITHSYSNSGTYNVALVSENQCGIDTIIEQIIVSNSAVPYINIYSNGGNQFCPNDAISFYNQYSASNYLWSFGDGTFSIHPDPQHAFSSIGNYQVILTVTNSCGGINKDTIDITIQNGLMAYSDFNYWPTPACPSQNISFNTWNTGTFQWNFGDGTTSNQSELFHAYSDTGNYTIQLIVTNGCGNKDTTYRDILIQYQSGNNPNAYLYFENFNNWGQYGPVDTITICTNSLVKFMNATGGDNLTYLWNFGDGNTATTVNAEHTFINSGLFEVSLIAINECGGKDTAYKWINVRDDLLPISSLNAMPAIICPGESVLFFDDRFNEQNQYLYSIWFGDGDSLVNFMNETDTIYNVLANHVYDNAGTYNAVFTVENSCGNVNTSNYTITVDSTGTLSTQYFVGNSTSGNNNGPNQFNDWSIPSAEPEHTFTFPVSFSQWQQGMNEDMYIVCWYGGMSIFEGEMGAPAGMIQLNAGENNTITVHAPVNNADSLVIAGIWYCNQPFNSDPDAYGILGAFKLEVDGNTTIPSPGLVIENWDGDCVPQQTGNNPDAACPGDLVEFFAVGGIQHEWHFGDGASATGLFASHTYADTGIYNAFVKITNACGVTDTVFTIVEIGNYNLPDGYLSIDGRWTCTNSPVTFWYNEDNGSNNDSYNYLWSFGDGIFSTLSNPVYYYEYGGEYIINLTVTNGCGSKNFVDTIRINDNYIEYFVFDGCSGMNNGYIELASQIWGNNISINWSNGSTSESLYNLSSGDYTVTISGNNMCTFIKTFTINNVQPLNITFDTNNESCPGNDDGVAEAIVTGGESPYYFFWGDGSESATIQNLVPGNYNITVLDANACNTTNNVTVFAAVPLTTSISATDVTCYGISDGTIDLTVNGGSIPYSYSWTDGYVTEDINDAHNGNYIVVVTDANGCTINDNVLINQPTNIVMTNTLSNATCGVADGSINLIISGGVTPYLFNWSNGATTEDISSLVANFYVITLTDANGCIRQNTFSITNPGAPTIDNIDITYVTCNGDGDGAISLTVSGGTTPYSFIWNTSSTTQNLSGLDGANYSITITDALSCVVVNPQINVYEPSVLEVVDIVTNISCFGLSDGTIELMPSGGNGSYSYTWSNVSTSNIINNLGTGTYYFTVTDQKGCLHSNSVSITEPSDFTYTLEPFSANCYGVASGSVNLTVSGATSPYSFLWDNGATTEDIDNVLAGVYDITITDSNNCTVNVAASVSEPSELIVSASVINVDCNGNNTGVIDIAVSGGTATYSYNWSNSSTFQDLNNVIAGTYNLTLTDANLCYKLASYTISQPNPLTASAVVSNISCNGANDGSFNVTIFGGTVPYSVLWTNGATTVDINNLAPGSYYGTITDFNGCTFSGGNTISEPAVLILSPSVENNNCPGDIDGTVYANPTGGTAPYSYVWSVVGNSNSVINLPAGNYSVTVTDSKGCDETGSVTITTPDALIINYVVTNASTNVSTDGAINITVSGGTIATDYSYLWNNSSITQDISGLLWGNYTVTVTDDNGCSVDSTIFVDFINAINSINETSGLFNVYPNPNNGRFFIENNNKAEIRIYNAIGELVYKMNTNELSTEVDLSSLPKGIYNINSKYNDKSCTKLFIIK